MKVLFIGDIVGKIGRHAVYNLLPRIKEQEGIDLVIANSENTAGGMGITSKIAHQLLSYGVDIITMGNHVWRKNELLSTIDEIPNFIRPANYPPGTPGNGYVIYDYLNMYKVAVINIAGRVFMDNLDCPFRTADNILSGLPDDVRIIIVDFHAEATSEKIAMGWYLAGRVSAVIGTHTHVMTADESILANRTAYITDVGMTGPFDSVIGVKKEIALSRFLTCMPARFEVASRDVRLSAVVIEIENTTGRAASIDRLQLKSNTDKHNDDK